MTSSTIDSYGIAPPGYRLPAATSVGPVTLQVAASLVRSITTSGCWAFEYCADHQDPRLWARRMA